MRKGLLLLTGVAALALAALPGAGWAAPSRTAQGIMVNLTAGGDFILTQNNLYQFNVATAATYFTNAWDGNAPTVTCTGPGCGTAPAAPAAPAPDASQVSGPSQQSACESNECVFFNGGTLTGLTYKQTAQIATGSGRTGATYTYTYTYDVTPTTTDPVPALTAWDLVNTTGGSTATIDIGATIAGESVNVSATWPCPVNNTAPCGKDSFSLLENDGVTSRVQNLSVTVTDNNNNGALLQSFTPGSTLVFGQDFPYLSNAGSNGNVAYLIPALGATSPMSALSILNTDQFKGNDNGGVNGTDLAQAVMDSLQASLAVGSYTVNFTGVVKDNTGTTSTAFSVTQQIHIIGEGCGIAN